MHREEQPGIFIVDGETCVIGKVKENVPWDEDLSLALTKTIRNW